MLSPDAFMSDTLRDLLLMRIPEDEAKERLIALTPDALPDDAIDKLLSEAVALVRESAVPFPSINRPVLDCCGTGGSGLPHFNTSTTVAFVLAAAGVPVVKFGNRGMSSKSGSFDFLEGLGLPVEVSLERVPEILDAANVVFVFAPQCFPQLGRFNALRRSLRVRTLFNFMGPLLNPANPAFRVLGVSDARMQSVMATYLAREQSTRRAMVVRAESGMDELDAVGATGVMVVADGSVTQQHVPPEAICQGATPPEETLDVSTNLEIFEQLVTGTDTTSWFFHTVCWNAAAGLKTFGVVETMADGRSLAAELLSQGKVAETLSECRRAYANGSG